MTSASAASAIPSFEKVNYAIRPNKNVERKLMLDTLSKIAERLPIPDYRYLGMGSLWFVDFILAHRRLAIEDLISFERPTRARRARFNRPYACIKVDARDFEDYLESTERLVKPVIAWIDSDEKWDSPIVGEVLAFCDRAPVNSVVILTLDATIPDGENYEDKASAFSSIQKFDLTSSPTVQSFAPGPAENRFADLLARSILDQVKTRVRRNGFIPTELFNFYYRDSAPMITIGVLIQQPQPLVDERWLKRRQFWIGNRTVIELPHLTPREKLALDTQMGARAGTVDARRLGGRISRIGIPKRSIKAYRRFYKYYPVFLEADV